MKENEVIDETKQLITKYGKKSFRKSSVIFIAHQYKKYKIRQTKISNNTHIIKI